MRTLRLALTIAAAALAAGVSATAAPAATAVPVSVKLVEALRAPVLTQGCPDIGLDVNCGTGEVRPFGQADSIVSINACGENCNLRWIAVAGGTFLLRETASDPSCPGACVPEWPHGAQFNANLDAEVVGGTGIFEGAAGSLTGSLKAAAWQAQIAYAGTITLAS